MADHTGRHRRPDHRRDRERGASAVEFALILIPLLTIVLGTIDFGLAMANDLALSNGARQGARYGVVAGEDGLGRDCNEIVAETQNGSTMIGMDTSAIAVTVQRNGTTLCTGGSATKPCQGSSLGDRLTVQAEYTRDFLFPLWFGGSMDLQASGVFQCEYT